MNGWEEIELGFVAEYAKDKIDANILNASNFISTENMLVDKGGISGSNYVPEIGKTCGFKVNDILISNI